jgi:hypothetical protein
MPWIVCFEVLKGSLKTFLVPRVFLKCKCFSSEHRPNSNFVSMLLVWHFLMGTQGWIHKLSIATCHFFSCYGIACCINSCLQVMTPSMVTLKFQHPPEMFPTTRNYDSPIPSRHAKCCNIVQCSSTFSDDAQRCHRLYSLGKSYISLGVPKIGTSILEQLYSRQRWHYTVITMASTVGYDLLIVCPCKKEPFINV